MYKLRVIVDSGNLRNYGLTVPAEIYKFFSGCYFNAEINMGSPIGIFFASGCIQKPTKEEVEKYEYTDCLA